MRSRRERIRVEVTIQITEAQTADDHPVDGTQDIGYQFSVTDGGKVIA